MSLVLLGVGAGISFVSLTSASLADVEPGDAGAASGLVNVMQQIGAALGLAVLVSAFGLFTKHEQLGGRSGPTALAHAQVVMVHGVDDVFRVGLIFTAAALVLIATFVQPTASAGPAVAGRPADAADELSESWLDDSPVAEAS